MLLLDGQTDEEHLAQFGAQAVDLLERLEFDALAQRFGYSIALGREPAAAIKADLEACLITAKTSVGAVKPAISVKQFGTDTSLRSLVECEAHISGRKVLVELIVTVSGPARHLTIEQVSDAA